MEKPSASYSSNLHDSLYNLFHETIGVVQEPVGVLDTTIPTNCTAFVVGKKASELVLLVQKPTTTLTSKIDKTKLVLSKAGEFFTKETYKTPNTIQEVPDFMLTASQKLYKSLMIRKEQNVELVTKNVKFPLRPNYLRLSLFEVEAEQV